VENSEVGAVFVFRKRWRTALVRHGVENEELLN